MLAKTNALNECNTCHCWYFLDKSFKYELYLYNGCHDFMEKSMNFDNDAIASIKESDHRIHFWYMSKNDAILV